MVLLCTPCHFSSAMDPIRHLTVHSKSFLTRHFLDVEEIQVCILFSVLKYSVSLNNIYLLYFVIQVTRQYHNIGLCFVLFFCFFPVCYIMQDLDLSKFIKIVFMFCALAYRNLRVENLAPMQRVGLPWNQGFS